MRVLWLPMLGFALLASLVGAEPKQKKKTPVDDKAIAELRKVIAREVAAGFAAEDEIVEGAVDYLSDEHEETALEPHAKRLTRELLAAHRRAQQSWPKTTDCDRLDAAFRALEKAGIVARQNFSDCQTCGAAEIGDEMQELQKRGRKVRGYTFYHFQDTERAVEGGGVFLSYGAKPASDAASVALGREIVETLRKHGLTVGWDGTIGQRILVEVDWKRRR